MWFSQISVHYEIFFADFCFSDDFPLQCVVKIRAMPG